VAVAQDAMNLTFYHWGLHGFVVYTQVGLMLGIVSHRWGMPMTMKTCFYPLLGDKVFGIIGDLIDTLSVVTTLFGVCTSLGLGVMQLAVGLERLTKDDVTGESSIRNTTATQVLIVWIITAIATVSVVSGIKNGIQRLSNVAFAMGLMILFVALYVDDTWMYLNIFVQSVGYYIQYVIQLGSITAAFAATPFEIFDAHGVDLSPSVSPAGSIHATTTEHKNWMDWWTLFYWGWWIAWSPFVGTFMAKISKGRTVSQFIIGSCIGPMAFGFIWFSIFGGAGIQMTRNAAANGILEPTVVAVLEQTTLPADGQLNAYAQQTGWVTGACAIQTYVHNCAATADCEFEYLKPPSLIVNLDQRSKEDMWYDMMLSYGAPDGFMGWLLYVFSMLSLVLYFVTSSDSGSLVIDILAANGVEDPPVIQRIFWACMEGLTATALLVAGGSNALNALSTVSIVAGLPYTALLCFICTSTWRALKMDAEYQEKGADNKGPGPQFDIELADIFCDPKKNIVSFLINTICPIKAIHSHGNIFYTIMSSVLWLCFIAFHFIQLGADGWWAMAWMAYTMNTLIIWDIRGSARRKDGIQGNMIEDFFAALLLHGGVLCQVEGGPNTVIKTASV
jgi:choline-glycine betaine transporter